MIITCPNCGARYRLTATAIADNARMRCAACDHRWVVGAAEPDDVAIVVDPAPEPEPAPVVEPAAEPVAETYDDEPGEDDDVPAPKVLRTMLAVMLGTALAIGAGALWITRLDPAELPVIGGELAALAPAALPLKVAFTAQMTPMPSGDRLLEIKGSVRNTGKAQVTLPDLEARLAGPGGTVRCWRIAAPVAVLAPNSAAAFVSTATGFPADATTVGIRPAG